jgi:enamine deaminase RidA (YjgF/YER057c/UK114 family)
VPVVGERLKAAGCKPTSTLVQVVRLAQPDWMIELEAMAVA